MTGTRTGRAGRAGRVRAAVAAALAQAWQIARGVAGEHAYEIYLEHHARTRPGVPPMGEREFWRRHVDRGDTDPGSRCC